MQNRSGSAHRPSQTTTLQRETVHDLRNLFGIVASAKHLLERDPARAQRQALLDALGEAATRGGRLTTRLLASDPAAGDLYPTDIGERLADLAPLMQALTRNRIALHIDVAVPHSHVRMINEAFDAAILELIANAVAADARHIAVRNRLVGMHVWTLVSDDGRGMSAAALSMARSGEDSGNAHGGGLSRVHHFARMTHGHLLIRSGRGVGTSIALILPVMLSAAGMEPGVSCTNIFLKPEENLHEKDRQPTTA